MNVPGGQAATESEHLAHELSNLLAVVLTRAAIVADQIAGPAANDLAELIAAAVRAGEISRRLVELTRDPVGSNANGDGDGNR